MMKMVQQLKKGLEMYKSTNNEKRHLGNIGWMVFFATFLVVIIRYPAINRPQPDRTKPDHSLDDQAQRLLIPPDNLEQVLREEQLKKAAQLWQRASEYRARGDSSEAAALERQWFKIRWNQGMWKHLFESSRGGRFLRVLFAGPSQKKVPPTAQLFRDLDNQAWALMLLKNGLAERRSELERRMMGAVESDQLKLVKMHRGVLDLALWMSWGGKLTPEEAYAHALLWKGAVAVAQYRMRQHRREKALEAQFAELQSITGRIATSFWEGRWATPDAQRPTHFTELNRSKEQIEQGISRGTTRHELSDDEVIALEEKAQTLPPFIKPKTSQDRANLADFLRKQSYAVRKELANRMEDRSRSTIDRLKASLPAGVILVDFLEYSFRVPIPGAEDLTAFVQSDVLFQVERRLTAFIISRERPLLQVELGPVAPIEDAAGRWRARYATPYPGVATRLPDPADDLRRLIWKPLMPHLGGAQTVLVSPDGVTTRFPLAALPGSKPGIFLIEETAIGTVPIPLLLAEPQGAPNLASPSALFVGGIDFDFRTDLSGKVVAPQNGNKAGAQLRFSPLPGTAREIEAIYGLFRQQFPEGMAKRLKGREATEEEVYRHAHRKCFLHLATHGFFAKANERYGKKEQAIFNPSLLSGLAFAGANRNGQFLANAMPPVHDAILTAMEVQQMDLLDADLVVLSACETGLGDVAAGEGVLGLQRAFHVAGCKQVVASLWKVDDEATAALMAKFYHELWVEKRPPLEALRAAQLTILRRPDLIPALAGSRGAPDQASAVALKLPDGRPNPELGRPQQARAATKLWAAFTVSGVSR